MNLVQRRRNASKVAAQQRVADEETRRQIALAVSLAVRDVLEDAKTPEKTQSDN